MKDNRGNRADGRRIDHPQAKTPRSKQAKRSKPPLQRESSSASTPSAVVGIGASAGGLDALKDLFRAMPPDNGMAFVVVQHLEPAHESRMADILAKYTTMPVAQAEDGMPVQANCIYTIPAGKYLSVQGGRLRLTEPLERHGMRMAIDFLLRSLAEDQEDKAICIILSGSGSDGTHGLRAIRSSGGMGMVQDPKTAQFGIMPQSAIDTGLVDYILPADRMPEVLLTYVHHAGAGAGSARKLADSGPSEELESILELLHSRTNSDYRCYKRGTVARRIERRMGLKQIAALADYLKFLRKDPQEVVQLAKDVLIGVSSFFRDSEAFEELCRLAIRPLVAGKSAGSPLRVWVPGCATGEEAYSVAILLLEEFASAGKGSTIQVFASDVDESALETARTGIYPDSIAANVSTEHLARFFSRKDDHFQVGKQLRDTVVFARQNLITDPPFSKMDLITCRNVLIYLQPEAQKQVISIFSFALNIGGHLFLGRSENIMDPQGLFEIRSKANRIYRLARVNRKAADLPVFPGAGKPVGVAVERGPAPPSAAELAILNQLMLLKHFGASILLIEPKGRILHFYGETEKYLGHPKGQASLNVFDMASGVWATKLRRTIDQSLQAGEPVTIRQVPISRHRSYANVTVAPVPGRARDERILAIILEDTTTAAAPPPATRGVAEDESALPQLEAEIKALRRELEESNQGHESASEELRAANEEVMSMNEELQSTNEGLETSKEELQSINEELNTVNNQLNEKVGELTDANNDLANLFAATEIATVFLDTQLQIKRFTPRATELLNLIPSDLGRPLRHIAQNFDGKSLSADAAGVMKGLSAVEKEVQMPDGCWYTMRILPYRTLDDRIEGAVVTFADVSRLKRMEASLKNAKAYAESIVGTVREPLLVLDSNLRVVSANSSFYLTFEIAPEATIGESLFELEDGLWNIPKLRGLLKDILPARSEFKDFQVEHDFPGLGPRIMRLNARRIEPAEGQLPLILLAIEDVTAHEQARKRSESLAVELEKRVQERTAELDRTVADLEAEIRERKLAEQRIKYTRDLLGLFAHKTSRKAYLEAVVALLREISGCVNVGVRLRNRQNEIPYEASVGFSREFLESESRLLLGRDECACTRVIVGRPRPCDMSAMTTAGSFFCGDTIEFANGLTEEDKAGFRGVCIGHGFASVAVIPVRYHDAMLGAIHLADKRTGMFPQDLVEFMESISPLIGEAAHRFSVEMELLENEERYRSLVAATSQIVWTSNAHGEVEGDIPSWRAFTGQSINEIRDQGWTDALHPEDCQRTAAVWSHAVETRSQYHTEYRVRRADGEYRDFAVRGVPVIEPDGAIREWVGTCTDITERKRADEQLKALNVALEQRANQLRALATELTLTEQQERTRLAHVLHDSLQQLLVGAKYHIDSLRRDAAADKHVDKRLGELEFLLADAIQLSRSLVVELSPPLLSEVGLAAALKWLGEEMKRIHGLTVRVTADNEIQPDTEGVTLLLFQAVRELLFNVVKHAGVKLAVVRISHKDGEEVQIEVEDKGAGFNPAVLDRRKGSATGLGLFGIRERIAYLGGHMEVVSAAGRGTRVTLVMGSDRQLRENSS